MSGLKEPKKPLMWRCCTGTPHGTSSKNKCSRGKIIGNGKDNIKMPACRYNRSILKVELSYDNITIAQVGDNEKGHDKFLL